MASTEAHTILSAQVLVLQLSKPVTLHTSSEHNQGLTENISLSKEN